MTLELNDDAALVLFDLLAEYGEQDEGRELVVRSAAERNALWLLHGALEKRLVAPFKQDYVAELEAARARLEEQLGPW